MSVRGLPFGLCAACLCALIMSSPTIMKAEAYEVAETTQEYITDENTFAIKGNIIFEGTGNIHIFLVTEEIFGTPFTGIQTQVLTTGQEECNMNRVPFTFTGIRPGIYGIRCYQDVNDNGTLDRGSFGPTEPWGMSWSGGRPRKWPAFKNISFEVTTDITDVTIHVQ